MLAWVSHSCSLALNIRRLGIDRWTKLCFFFSFNLFSFSCLVTGGNIGPCAVMTVALPIELLQRIVSFRVLNLIMCYSSTPVSLNFLHSFQITRGGIADVKDWPTAMICLPSSWELRSTVLLTKLHAHSFPQTLVFNSRTLHLAYGFVATLLQPHVDWEHWFTTTAPNEHFFRLCHKSASSSKTVLECFCNSVV